MEIPSKLLSLVLFSLSSWTGFHLSSFEIDGAPGDTFLAIKRKTHTHTQNITNFTTSDEADKFSRKTLHIWTNFKRPIRII